ncbi:MAG: hypothetical protein P4L36_12800 [Holophaga sp.]|nr:hypothetical protein [Holophaga sp.]
MRLFSSLITLALPAILVAGGADDARLDYRLKVCQGDPPTAQESGFRVLASPALVTRNKVKRPRMGSWRIEPLPGSGAAPSPALLAQVLGLCYFSGPSSQAVPLATGMKLGGRWCRLWQVQTPPQVGAYVYLAEVAPGLLALAYLSARLPEGDLRSLEIHLAGLSLGRRAAPAEEGTALLKTLQHWADRPEPLRSADPGTVETEQVP